MQLQSPKKTKTKTKPQEPVQGNVVENGAQTDTATDLLATSTGAIFLVGQNPNMGSILAKLVQKKLEVHTGTVSTCQNRVHILQPVQLTNLCHLQTLNLHKPPPLPNPVEEELILTKFKLAEVYKENAKLHNTLNTVYTTWFKGAATKTNINHKSAAESALASADAITMEVVLQQKYGFTVSF